MKIATPQTDAAIIGFDSAWEGRSQGAICAIMFDGHGRATFSDPKPAYFCQALEFIERVRHDFSLCLVALDQPTIVPNAESLRPVERVAGSVVSFIGGGVQPANRSQVGRFGDDAPIWKFKSALGAEENPDVCRLSPAGRFLMEVYPALALPGLHAPFAEQGGSPKYNPKKRKKFCISDWQAVNKTVENVAASLEIVKLSVWAKTQRQIAKPQKRDQDCVDAAICALVGLIWRACDSEQSVMIGDTDNGYMVTPVSSQTRQRLECAAVKKGVPIN